MEKFKVCIISAGGVRHDLYCGLTEAEAIEICDENNWEWCDENRFVWDMDYVEDCSADGDSYEEEYFCGSDPATLDELKAVLPLLRTEQQLNDYVEQAAYNDHITHKEYCEFYQAALARYHEIVGE